MSKDIPVASIVVLVASLCVANVAYPISFGGGKGSLLFNPVVTCTINPLEGEIIVEFGDPPVPSLDIPVEQLERVTVSAKYESPGIVCEGIDYQTEPDRTSTDLYTAKYTWSVDVSGDTNVACEDDADAGFGQCKHEDDDNPGKKPRKNQGSSDQEVLSTLGGKCLGDDTADYDLIVQGFCDFAFSTAPAGGFTWVESLDGDGLPPPWICELSGFEGDDCGLTPASFAGLPRIQIGPGKKGVSVPDQNGVCLAALGNSGQLAPGQMVYLGLQFPPGSNCQGVPFPVALEGDLCHDDYETDPDKEEFCKPVLADQTSPSEAGGFAATNNTTDAFVRTLDTPADSSPEVMNLKCNSSRGKDNGVLKFYVENDGTFDLATTLDGLETCRTDGSLCPRIVPYQGDKNNTGSFLFEPAWQGELPIPDGFVNEQTDYAYAKPFEWKVVDSDNDLQVDDLQLTAYSCTREGDGFAEIAAPQEVDGEMIPASNPTGESLVNTATSTVDVRIFAITVDGVTVIADQKDVSVNQFWNPDVPGVLVVNRLRKRAGHATPL